MLEHARLLFVCVDTPPTYSGDADLSRVEAVIEALPASDRHGIVMKSTVPVGTGANVRRRLDELGKDAARVRVESRVPEGGLGSRGLHEPGPRRGRRRSRIALGRGRGGAALTSRSTARSCAPTSPPPR